MKIRELMTSDVESCSPEDSLQQAAQVMADIDVGIVPIVRDGGYLQGCITDRDIVIRAVAKGMDINSTHVEECMTSGVISCSPEQTAQEAAQLMADHQVRRLPVVEEGRLIGIVAIGDLAVQGASDEAAGFALSEISESTHSGIH
ncbi:CBS domain-containing protein [Tumebacillus algifaecis]|uniref:CBS domain-containing protein n=1 Tax=Tumebacillus algifaecis TaxID=1214604 RepID=A0A223CYQ5_9BACL|nr:CBS domain-containing protein [Tumebacillus algifaecis]ASS74539.1 CBS domain-containing protein [Tumebacillus algifaecis]